MALSVLIVDDQADFRELARSVLEADGFDVVGEAVDGARGIEAARALRPEVVVLDIGLPGMDGFAVAGRLQHLPAPPRVVLVSTRPAADYGPRVGQAPACGFIAKHELSGGALTALLA